MVHGQPDSLGSTEVCPWENIMGLKQGVSVPWAHPRQAWALVPGEGGAGIPEKRYRRL